MASAFETIFPRQANNNYRGGAVAFYGFLFIVATHAFAATVHYFTYDSGKIQIAGMIPFEGNPNPKALIFAIGADAGAWELILLMIYGIVLWRYRNLVPLMFALGIVKGLLNYGNDALHHVGPEFFTHTPPARHVKTLVLFFPALMLLLSVRQSMRSGR